MAYDDADLRQAEWEKRSLEAIRDEQAKAVNDTTGLDNQIKGLEEYLKDPPRGQRPAS